MVHIWTFPFTARFQSRAGVMLNDFASSMDFPDSARL